VAKHLLTDRKVRNAKPKAKAYRLFDGAIRIALASRVGSDGVTHHWHVEGIRI
jgi:hypothetical protein